MLGAAGESRERGRGWPPRAAKAKYRTIFSTGEATRRSNGPGQPREAAPRKSRKPRNVGDPGPRSGFLLFLAGRLPVHFSTVFPLERRDMVMGGAAERRLQASHRHRCTWWRAMVPPWCIHSLVRSLVCRVDRRPAAASDLHRWLGGRCELPHEDDWVSSAGSRAQQTTC